MGNAIAVIALGRIQVMFRAVSCALGRFTHLEDHDSVSPVPLGASYNVIERDIES